ncbi:MAG: hypothetical protein PVF51_07995 [Nitrospirota bacterium]|jgi:hypothetical protein
MKGSRKNRSRRWDNGQLDSQPQFHRRPEPDDEELEDLDTWRDDDEWESWDDDSMTFPPN